jgi:uncharacterized oligopeptide transporter (OPT) family protein
MVGFGSTTTIITLYWLIGIVILKSNFTKNYINVFLISSLVIVIVLIVLRFFISPDASIIDELILAHDLMVASTATFFITSHLWLNKIKSINKHHRS